MEKAESELLELARDNARADLENPHYYGSCFMNGTNGKHAASQPPLHLFTASAGSGKTWRLAFEYISLLLKDAYLPSEDNEGTAVFDNYRHILAITFTNKATAEMKDRILQNLELLSAPASSDEMRQNERISFLQSFSARLGVSASVVAQRAKLVYSNLLHDYSHFHILTIDSFFQSVLRNLAQELGIGSYWEVELDSDSVLTEAVHRLLNRVCADDDLRRWVTDYVKSRIDDNKNWNVEGELVSFGANLFSEAVVTNDEMDLFLSEPSAALRERIKKIKNVLYRAKQECWNTITSQAEAFVSFCQTNAVPPSSFAQRQTIYTFVASLAAGKQKDPSDTVLKFIDAVDADEMLKIGVAAKERTALFPLIGQIHALVVAAKQAYDENYGVIIVLEQILKNINQIGLLADMKEEVANIQEEQNIFMLAYAQPLLHKFITTDDAPFVFERIGESLRYMMIDEFQDTSKVQFQNFRPLIQNCCAENSGSLIVGDAKQAIYRFRNGDWSLIESLRTQSLGLHEQNPQLQMDTAICGHNMQFNYRSAPVVVNFNNALFKPVEAGENVSFYENVFKTSLVSLLADANDGPSGYLRQIYSTSQQFSAKSEGGFVRICFHKTEDEDKNAAVEWPLATLFKEIEMLHDNGVEYSDITILSRFNKEIPPIAEFLKRQGIPVVSDLAFLLRASIRVRLIVDALRYIDARSAVSAPSSSDALYKQLLTYDFLRFVDSDEQVSDSLPEPLPIVGEWCRFLDGKVGFDGTENGDRLADLPIYDMVEQIYHLLFPKLPTDVYVQCFLDHIREFVSRRVVTLHDVIDYWDSKLSVVSIPADLKQSEGVRMMSIHKSKGLEAHTVILANCSWKATSDRAFSFWCQGKGRLGKKLADAELPLIPVDFSEKLKQTAFADDYWEEMSQLHAENVNLLYVALTRARFNLVVLDEFTIPKSEEKTGPKLAAATMGRLLYEVVGCCPLVDDCVRISASGADVSFSNRVFQYGSVVPSANSDDSSSPTENVGENDTFVVKGRFRQSTAANRFVRSGSLEPDENIDYGNTMHALLAKVGEIICPEDCPAAIAKAADELQFEGLLAANAAHLFIKDLCEAFSALGEDALKCWFGPRLKVYVESGIVLFPEMSGQKDGVEEYRPDRVVLDIESGIFRVIDYKTGTFSDAAFIKHSKQVRNYMGLVAKINPLAKVEGFVWYVCDKQVRKVI